MRRICTLALVIAMMLAPGLATSAPETPPATRAAALKALTDSDPARRLAAVQRLAQAGTMANVERLAKSLRDASEPVREAASVALWALWSRSGDAAIDRKLAEGTKQMGQGDFAAALALFDQIVKARPDFAEGWNKRATVLFLLRRDAESLRDCDKVLERNRHHFGALSGMAQIHLRRGDVEQALKAYQRAFEINPNLDDGAAVLRMLQEAVRTRRESAGGNRT